MILLYNGAKFHLYFVRHGETPANKDRSVYKNQADHTIRLTETGVVQAKKAGCFLLDHLLHRQMEEGDDFGRIRLYHSPYYRTRETAFHILDALGEGFDYENGELTYREDPLIFEQKAGVFDGMDSEEYAQEFPSESADYNKNTRHNGKAYAGVPLGESIIDVVARTKHFFGTVADDAVYKGIHTAIVVTHGVTLRAIVGRWMKYVPEWLDAEMNPGNCWVRHISGDGIIGYKDDGYIYSDKPDMLFDPNKTQRTLPDAKKIYVLASQRPSVIPPGVTPLDPFARHRKQVLPIIHL